MQEAKQQFAHKLRDAMAAAGYEVRPAVLEREFNLRHWGKPMMLHGVRRWLLGETLPDYKKMQTLAQWLGVPVHELAYGGAPAKKPQTPTPWHGGMGYQGRDMFELYLRLPVPQRRLIRDVILAVAKAHAAEQQNSTNDV